MMTRLADHPVLFLAGHRLLSALPILLGVSLLSFWGVNLLPGNTALQLSGVQVSAEQLARLEAALGLDQPLWLRYWTWLTDMMRGDFGRSLATGQPVAERLSDALPLSLALVGYALLLALLPAIVLALCSARRPLGWLDRVCALFSMSCLSLAPYVVAILLVLVFAVQLSWLPALGGNAMQDSISASLSFLTLPAIAIALPLFGLYVRFLRGDLLAQWQGRDYILAARARGLAPWPILLRHALPNALPGLLTLVGLNLGSLLGATVIIEQMFALPGMGQLLLQAVMLRDITVVQAIVLLLAVATVLANLLVDVLHVFLDPRVRYGQH